MVADLLVQKLEQRDTLSEAEKQALEDAIARVVEHAHGSDIVRQGTLASESALLVDGMASRYVILADGTRQIAAIHIAGDFVDLHSFLLRRMDHGVAALTTSRVAMVPHEKLHDITERHPHLGRLLWLSTLIDAAIFRQWLVNIGRRAARERMAHLFCEQLVRHRAVGLAEGDTFPLPITQNELADALGLSVVHANRTVQELRADGLIAWRGGQLTILEFDRLASLAEFDPTYLSLEHIPR